MLEVRSGPQVPTFRNSTYLDPQVGPIRDLGVRQTFFLMQLFFIFQVLFFWVLSEHPHPC